MANTTNWLNISATSGSSGETILTLSANKNLSLYDKRAEITAYNPVYNISAKTYVTIQSFAPIIELSPAIIGVPDTGGTYELNISANCAWVISFPDLVSSYSTSAGTGNATVTLTVPGTSADTTLVGNIVVTAEGGQMSKTARIEQYGQGVQLSVSHSEILFPGSGAVRYFTVTANCVYDVSVVSGDDWAVVSPQSGYTGVSSFTVTVDGTNTGTTTREGIVRISAPGVTRYIMLYQYPKETRLTVYYNATSTTNPTELYEVGTGFSKAETPDGTVIPGDSYIFPDTGSNRVFYTMTGTSIPANTFSGMSALTSVVIPDNITTIGEGAFRDCVNLTSVTIPDTVTVLPDNCFNGCSSLTAIPISESVTYIGEGCFAGCTGIETVTIPTGVTGIGAGCFSGSGVETIYANSPTPAVIDNGTFTSGNLQDIIVPCSFFDAYKTAWSAYEEYMSCRDDEQLYFTTDTSNVRATGETRTITILNTNIIQNRIGLTLPSDFPSQGAYVVDGNVIYLTYPANPSSTSTRTWTITVRATTKSGKALSGSYRIKQNADSEYSIPYTADTSSVNKLGETRTITIDTSGLVESSITIGVGGATGVITSYNNGVITVLFPENTSSTVRTITVTINAITTNGNNGYANITYNQKGNNMSDEYLTFVIETSGTIRMCALESAVPKTIEYKINDGEWTTYTSANPGGPSFSVSAGDVIRFRGNNSQYAQSSYNYNRFDTTCRFSLRGNIMSLINASNFESLTALQSNFTFFGLFASNTGLTDASNLLLPATTLAGSCYRYMFYDCTSLTTAPELPATTLADNCYRFMFAACTSLTTAPSSIGTSATTMAVSACTNMFDSCTSLTTAPELPATTLADNCYESMFRVCTSLTTAPSILPATTLATNCYTSMFYYCTSLTTAPSSIGTSATTMAVSACTNMFEDCTSLTTAPELPATILAQACYRGMFEDCTSLTTAPSILPATTLVQNCYYGMFDSCTSLTTAPELPATILAQACYRIMFYGCTSLTTAPELPATTLADNCYESMFRVCTSLTTAPELPATTLAQNCYYGMFYGCTSLTTAPELPATTLAQNCYIEIFGNCSSLNYIKCLATDISASNCTTDWVMGVASAGTFVTPSTSTWTTGIDGIPSGWTRVDSDS